MRTLLVCLIIASFCLLAPSPAQAASCSSSGTVSLDLNQTTASAQAEVTHTDCLAQALSPVPGAQSTTVAVTAFVSLYAGAVPGLQHDLTCGITVDHRPIACP
jgi:hypothetical protein